MGFIKIAMFVSAVIAVIISILLLYGWFVYHWIKDEFSISKKTKKTDEFSKKTKKTEESEKKWVFKGSVGWLLFWLIVATPIGIIYLIFEMEKK